MADAQTVWGMGGGGWKAAGVVGSGVGTLLAAEGTLASGRAASRSSKSSAWAVRRNAKGEALDKWTGANRARGDARTILENYSVERRLRADKSEIAAAGTLSAYAKSGVSLDSDSVRAVHEYEATVAREQEGLHRSEMSRQVAAANTTAADLGVSAEAGISGADIEAGFLLMDGQYRRAASRVEALGQYATGVASIASMFAR